MFLNARLAYNRATYLQYQNEKNLHAEEIAVLLLIYKDLTQVQEVLKLRPRSIYR
jgi:hypothetical protein